MKKYLILFIVAGLSLGYSCTNSNSQVQSASILVQESTIAKNLAPKDFAAHIKSKNDAIVLDVRTKKEVDAGHLANATNIDIYGPNFKEEVSKLDKSKPVFIYCHSGRRSANAMATLKGLGFVEVYNLSTGISGWQAAGLPIEK